MGATLGRLHRTPTLVALRKMVRASDLIDRSTVSGLDEAAPRKGRVPTPTAKKVRASKVTVSAGRRRTKAATSRDRTTKG